MVHSAAAGLETSGDIPELQQAALSAQPFPQNKLLRTEQVQNDASMNKVYAGRRGGRGRVHLKALTGEEQENFEANAVQELLGILGSSLKYATSHLWLWHACAKWVSKPVAFPL